ncbi:MAG: signal recognition particle-docking protein FtsY [Nanoarchaeota archaeon]
MFRFLRDKLKKGLNVFSKKVEEELEPVEEPAVLVPIPEQKPGPEIVKERPVKEHHKEEPEAREPAKKEPTPVVTSSKEERGKEEPAEPRPAPEVEEKIEDPEQAGQPKEEIKEQKPKKRFLGIFGRKERDKSEEEESKHSVISAISKPFTTAKISAEKFDSLFWDLEVMLLENNVAVEAVEHIKEKLKEDLVDKPLRRGHLSEAITSSLKESIQSLFDVEQIDLIQKIKEKKPYVICLIGVNGAGKTTTIAKIVHYLKSYHLSSVIAASDTFRAASLEQLQQHADNLGVKLIKHDYGSDPAAVAFDAIEHAKAKNKDVVLIDTAGRQHSNTNLMAELKKVIKVSKPDLKIFVGDSLTGNDCVEQAREFHDAVGVDGIVLSKVDVDEKGGAAISVSYITKKPILFIGTGQDYGDLDAFDPRKVLETLGFT